MYKNKSGIALILAVGIISALAVLALGLSLINRVELKAVENFRQLARAEFIAQAGLAQAISELKYGAEGAQQNPYDTVIENVFYQGNAAGDNMSVALDSDAATHPSCDMYNGTIGDGISGAFAGGTYRLKIIDCASRINVNTPLAAGDVDAENDFSNMLQKFGLSVSQAQNLINYRRSLAGAKFHSREEIKLVDGIGSISAFEDFITLYGNADTGSGHTQRFFVNVNTAHKTVLNAVIAPMISLASALSIVDQIDSRRRTNPFDGKDPDTNVNNFAGARGEFNAFLRYLRASGSISSDAQLAAILEQSDPNRNNTNSTHLGFDAGGCYEIEVVGSCQGAQKHLTQVVKVYEKIYETTKAEFGDCDVPTTTRVTWKDNCPVNYNCLETLETDAMDPLPNAITVANALKLGFWDDFKEDYDDSGTQTGDWIAVQERFEINAGGSGMLRTWPAAGFAAGVDYFPEIRLDPTRWKFTEFSVRARMIDETSRSKSSLRDNLPWPAIPREPSWYNQGWYCPPSALNCPDIAAGIVTADTMLIRSWNAHERFLNVTHLKFGRGAIFCSFPQTTEINLTDGASTPIYGNWVNYDGSGYIFFAPWPTYASPGDEPARILKSYDNVSHAQVSVFCNDWLWWAWWGWHWPIDGTIIHPLPQYQPDRVIVACVRGGLFYTDPFGVYNSGQVAGQVHTVDGATSFVATEALMDYADRAIEVVGMGTLFDLDNVRIIPRQGVYTSKLFAPANSPLEWGTISLNVSLPDGAAEATEKVFVTTSFSAGEDLAVAPGPDALPPASALTPAGGTISFSTAPGLSYRVYLYSDYMVSTFSTVFKKIPMVEDVSITYLPHTEILYQNMR